jgi:hypothetical protein
LIISETLYGEDPVMVVKEFGIDGGVWQEEALEVSIEVNLLPNKRLTRQEPRRRR